MSASALLVVDMQNSFCHPEGSMSRLGYGLHGTAAALAAARTAVDAAHGAGVPVVFTRQLYRAGYPDLGRNLDHFRTGYVALDALRPGSWDADVVADLDPHEGDFTVDKTRFDAFLWTSLEPLLSGLGVDHLAVAGVLTTVCVESTVRSAFARDFEVSLVTDACTDRTARLHDLGVEVMTEWRFVTPVEPDAVGTAVDAAVA